MASLKGLLVSFVLQAGKSLVVREVLLSVVREDDRFGVNRPDEVSVLHLSIDQLPLVSISFVLRCKALG